MIGSKKSSASITCLEKAFNCGLNGHRALFRNTYCLSEGAFNLIFCTFLKYFTTFFRTRNFTKPGFILDLSTPSQLWPNQLDDWKSSGAAGDWVLETKRKLDCTGALWKDCSEVKLLFFLSTNWRNKWLCSDIDKWYYVSRPRIIRFSRRSSWKL